MDNFGANGNVYSNETFGFVPPNLIAGIHNDTQNRIGRKEEEDRRNYEKDHEIDGKKLF